MDDIVTNAEIRRQRRLRRLDASKPRCVVCGCDDVRCLEAHHLAGQAYHGELHWVCRNCHRKLSDAQQDHPGPVTYPPSFLEVVAHYLLGLAEMLRLIVETLVEFARQLIEMSRKSATGNAP